jgi:hypothetical protein
MIWKVKEFRHKIFMTTTSAHHNFSTISTRGKSTHMLQFFTVGREFHLIPVLNI